MKILTTTSLLFLANTLFSQVTGCTDSQATNFNANATQNDGSCVYANTTIDAQSSLALGPELMETSGLILFNEVLVSHNDNDDTQLYQINPATGATLAAMTIPSVSNVDWEEIAEDETYIYIGDFGNNATGIRTDLKIYRFPKSEYENPTTIDTIQFSYNTQTDFETSAPNASNFDCEAFIVTNDKMYLFTKEWTSNATSVFEVDKNPGTHEAIYKGTLQVDGLITGATYLEDEKLIALAGYSTALNPFIYLLYDYDDADFFSGNKRKININLPFHQMEGITTEDGLLYYLTNEKLAQGPLNNAQKLYTFDLSEYVMAYLFPETIAAEVYPKNNSFQVYPNPFDTKFWIECEPMQQNEVNAVEVIDGTGKTVYCSNLKNSVTQVDLAACSLEAGLYYVIFNAENARTKHVFRLVKE